MASDRGVRVQVEPRRLDARPGAPLTLFLEVYNSTEIIDGFTVTLIGLDQQWVVSDPEWVSLFPDQEGSVVLTVTLPFDFPAGDHRIGVRVASKTNPSLYWLSELDLSVAAVPRAEMLPIEPETLTGGGKGRFGVTVRNTGNVPVDIAIQGDDAENAMDLLFTPTRFVVEPSEQTSSQLTAVGRRPLTGAPVVRTLTIYARGPGVDLERAAVFVQKPWIPRFALTLGGMLAMLALWALVVGWAIDLIIDDTDQDLAAGIEEGLGAVVEELQADAADAAGAAGTGGEVPPGALGQITGTVAALSNTAPVAGATVSAFPLIGDGERQGEINEERDPVEATTGEDGVYLLAEMGTGSYKLRVEAPGFATVWYANDPSAPPEDPIAAATTVEIPRGDDAPALDFLLVSGPGLIAPGTVSGAVSAAGNEASVTITVEQIDDNGKPRELTLGAEQLDLGDDGAYAVTGLATPGTYRLHFAASGLSAAAVLVGLDSGGSKAGVDVVLVPAGTIAGAITLADVEGNVAAATSTDDVVIVVVKLDEDGLPVALAAGEGTVNGPTDDRYSISGLVTPATYELTFSKIGYATTTTSVALDLGAAATTTDVVLVPGDGTITGVVTDGTAPLGGVAITISDGETAGTTATTTETVDGLFTLDGLSTPAAYTLTFAKEGFADTTVEITLEAGASVDRSGDEAVVMVGAAGSISGSVSFSGAPLGGVRVLVTGDGEAVFETTTLTAAGGGRAVGTYVVAGLPTPATYTVTFLAEGLIPVARSVTLGPGEDLAGIDAVVGGGSIVGTVSDPLAPLAGVVVEVSGGGETFGTVTGSEGGDVGRFAVSGISYPGTYTVTFAKEGYIPQAHLLELQPGEQQVLTIVLSAGPGTITGTVADDARVPVGDVAVVLSSDLAGPEECSSLDPTLPPTTRTGESGTYRIGDIPTPSNVVLCFSKPGYVAEGLAVTLGPGGQVQNADARLERIPVTIAGQVTTSGATGTVGFDQRFQPSTFGSFGCGDQVPGSLYQSFTASASRLHAVELRLLLGSSFPAEEGVTSTVRVWSSAGALIGEASSNVFYEESDVVPVRFELSQTGVTEPGASYFLEWQCPAIPSGGSTADEVLTWMGASGGGYPGGSGGYPVRRPGRPPVGVTPSGTEDHVFATYGSIAQVLPGVAVSAGAAAATTGPAGLYALEGIPPGDITVSFSKAGYRAGSAGPFEAGPGESVDGVDAVLQGRPGSIAGRLQCFGGGLSGSVIVSAYVDGTLVGTAETSGAFTIGGLPTPALTTLLIPDPTGTGSGNVDLDVVMGPGESKTIGTVELCGFELPG